jgi:PhnB protein
MACRTVLQPGNYVANNHLECRIYPPSTFICGFNFVLSIKHYNNKTLVMAQLNPYLNFHGQCKEAMNFYKEIFGGELEVMLAGESPVADQVPAEFHKGVLHSSLKTPGFEIMATDMTPTPPIEGNTVHLCVRCNSEEETRLLFDRLSEGGKVIQPLNKMFFGWIGTVADKYEKHWMLECDL